MNFTKIWLKFYSPWFISLIYEELCKQLKIRIIQAKVMNLTIVLICSPSLSVHDPDSTPRRVTPSADLCQKGQGEKRSVLQGSRMPCDPYVTLHASPCLEHVPTFYPLTKPTFELPWKSSLPLSSQNFFVQFLYTRTHCFSVSSTRILPVPALSMMPIMNSLKIFYTSLSSSNPRSSQALRNMASKKKLMSLLTVYKRHHLNANFIHGIQQILKNLTLHFHENLCSAPLRINYECTFINYISKVQTKSIINGHLSQI